MRNTPFSFCIQTHARETYNTHGHFLPTIEAGTTKTFVFFLFVFFRLLHGLCVPLKDPFSSFGFDAS